MSRLPRNPRRDLTEPVIVLAFLPAGLSGKRVSGEDCGDLVVGRNGIDRWIEVKTGRRQLREGQKAWAESWRGARPLVCRSLDDAVKVIERWPTV